MVLSWVWKFHMHKNEQVGPNKTCNEIWLIMSYLAAPISYFTGDCSMKFKTLLTIFSAVAFVLGLGCVLAPAQMVSGFDVSLSPMGYVVYQFWGSTLMGLGMLGWFLRNIEESALQKKLALSFLIATALGPVMAIRGQYAGANSFGWSTVAMFALFTFGFGSFLFLNSGK
jgi:hypothetical protein